MHHKDTPMQHHQSDLEHGEPHRLTQQVIGRAIALGAGYAGALAILERKLPIAPSWVAVEVIGGVLAVGLPVMSTARQAPPSTLSWRDYERLVMAGFIGVGLPICLWQLVEYGVLRRKATSV